ncbi:hypothetical protein [Caudoviricetes sp.]|nr:hypothetical protein [Caudoviricetes sp.]
MSYWILAIIFAYFLTVSWNWSGKNDKNDKD